MTSSLQSVPRNTRGGATDQQGSASSELRTAQHWATYVQRHDPSNASTYEKKAAEHEKRIEQLRATLEQEKRQKKRLQQQKKRLDSGFDLTRSRPTATMARIQILEHIIANHTRRIQQLQRKIKHLITTV